MSVALGYVPFTPGSECREAKESESGVYRNWAVSILLCRRTSGCHRNEKNIFIKMLFSTTDLYYLFHSLPLSVRVALMGLIKQGSGVSTCTLQTVFSQAQNSVLDSQLASFNRCIHVNMFTQNSILYSIQKNTSILHIPPRAERPTCLSERFAKKAELFGWLTISLSLSKCIFSVNPSFQRQDMKS